MSIKTKTGITFVEVMVAALLLVVVLLPVFNFLTKSVRDTEKIYAECIAITKAKQIMDTMLFQIPWQDIRVDTNDRSRCIFEVPDLVVDPDDHSIFTENKKERNEKEKNFLIRGSLLESAEIYTEAINDLVSSLDSLPLKSKGLLAFKEYLREYANEPLYINYSECY